VAVVVDADDAALVGIGVVLVVGLAELRGTGGTRAD
jgi:hypothetical protein